ncbi:Aft1 HRA domain-containing protein [Chaetomium strumarium]|uniref:Aft1 HRA domain-containing protein n=1 Tax=Chaetomium strumarium TaxID=1170767 RepID=A0AAJ0M4T5_9PEZI|nr:Aft1 HRA domain-containing protein [Chaetomium strumarium]
MAPPTRARGGGESKSPEQSGKPSPSSEDKQVDGKRDEASVKADEKTTTEQAKPLAPPPRPGQQPNTNSPDYFSNPVGGSLSLEPNPFEQSFSGAPPDTPGGGTKLPSVAALTSPSALLPGGATPFPWGSDSLRTGNLSPAMLAGPAADYFGDTQQLRVGFPTPNESSLRTGLTPGGSGSMFPAPSPNAGLFGSVPAATPGTLDFHRTAVSAAIKQREQSQALHLPRPAAPTSQPQETISGIIQPSKPESKFDPHDNDAANGLFMLAQGRGGTQPPPLIHPRYSGNPNNQINGAPSLAGSSVRAVSEASPVSDETEQTRPNTRARGKRSSGNAATTSRRKAEDTQTKAPAAKKSKTNNGAAGATNGHDSHHSDDSNDNNGGKDGASGNGKSKMTDEEKRANFLERNRVAALKCRQRKKQWLASLQAKVEQFSRENDELHGTVAALREEVVTLKTLLMAHKDCPVTQQQGASPAYIHQLEAAAFNANAMNAFAIQGGLQNHPVIPGPPMDRRFS